jgi:hypothetical protein
MVLQRWTAAAATAAVTLALAGCGPTSQDGEDTASPEETTSSPTETWDLVVLADSSGWGVAEAWAELIRRDEGVEVHVTDLAIGTQSGRSLLDHLTTEGDPQREAVAEAEVISVYGSPNALRWRSDMSLCFYDPTGTRAPTRVTAKYMAPYVELWRDILAEINLLRNGRPTALRTRDLYVPVVPQQMAAGTAEACARGFAAQSGIVRKATEQAGGTFIPVYRAFNGPDGLEDPVGRGLLDEFDVQHPSDEGASFMAELHHRAGYEELTRE